MSTPRTGRNPLCVVWWLWQEIGRCSSWELTFAGMLVCSKADLRQVENEATAIKNGCAWIIIPAVQQDTKAQSLEWSWMK